MVKLFSRTEVAHSAEMKQARSEKCQYSTYRYDQIDVVVSAAERYGIAIRDKVVLDLGCSDGVMSAGYLGRGAAKVIGVDIDGESIESARTRFTQDGLSFHVCGTETIPLPDDSVDAILSYDVFEHVSKPAAVLAECRRVLRPGGRMLIGTWGWRHPFAPHLWSTMPVPWAHVLFSERTVLRTCRRVYNSPWYTPTRNDLDDQGRKIPGKFENEEISRDYLNKLLVADFRQIFRESGLEFQIHPQAFGSRYARWTKPLLNVKIINEFITSYIWATLSKPL